MAVVKFTGYDYFVEFRIVSSKFFVINDIFSVNFNCVLSQVNTQITADNGKSFVALNPKIE
jgi:hypothetical protein